MKKHGMFQISKEGRMTKTYGTCGERMRPRLARRLAEARSHMVLGSEPRSLDFIQRQRHRKPFYRRVVCQISVSERSLLG